MRKRTAAISTGPETHLDHLAPICDLLGVPLIVIDQGHKELATKFYPMIETIYCPIHHLTIEQMAEKLDTIITCGKFWALEMQEAIRLVCGKEMRFVHAPHGYSDKESLVGKSVEQDIVFTYGESGASETIVIGNIRFLFYQKHKAHFDRLAEAVIDESEKATILYAPTWSTKATSTSFFTACEQIVDDLASEYQLLIKLHPLLEENDPASFYRITGRLEDKATFITQFPPIYPILEKTDIYLGDSSSVGYDFLHYDQPMFFLDQCGALPECGLPYHGVSSLQKKQLHLTAKRQSVYQEVFSEGINGKEMQEKLSLFQTK